MECALGAFAEAVRLDPRRWQARYNRALAFLATDQLVPARVDLESALSIHPAAAEAANNLAVVYWRLGEPAKAYPLFERATRQRPDYADAYVNWAVVLGGDGNYDAAAGKLQTAIRYAPAHLAANTTLGMVLAKLHKPREALTCFRKVADLDPTSAQAHLNAGIVLGDLLDFGGALKEFSEAARLAPDLPEAHYNRGRALADLNRFDEARAELETACRLAKSYVPALDLLGRLEREAGNLVHSSGVLERAIAADARDVRAHLLLALNLIELERQQAAIPHWKAVLQIDASNREALYNLGRFLSETQPDEATMYRRRFADLQKRTHDVKRVQSLNDAALAHAQEGKWPEAIDEFREAFSLCGECSESARLHRNLGLLYARKGDLENAEAQLSTALKLEPNDQDAAQGLSYVRGNKPRKVNKP